MQYSLVKQLIDGVWMINPLTASAYLPLLKGALSGLHFEKEPEPENSRQSYLKVANSSDPDSNSEIAITPLRGVILKDDGDCGQVGTKTLASRLKEADRNDNIIGHIIICESGGGLASAVPFMADAINSLTKPIVAWVDGMACSAAMYICSYCDKIIASRAEDQVGCIGTLIQFQDFPKYSKLDDGSINVRVYADGSEEKNEEYEDALEGNFKLIKERILNPHNEQFKADMRTNRPNVKDEHLKGRTYAAKDVVSVLVDDIGDFQSAVDAVITINNQRTNLNNKKMEQETTVTPCEETAQVETQEVAQLREDLSQRDARISELEEALAAATEPGGAQEPAAVVTKTDTSSPEEIDDFQARKEYCQTLKKKLA